MQRKTAKKSFGWLVALLTLCIPIYLEASDMINHDNSYWLVIICCIGTIITVGILAWVYLPELKRLLKKGGRAKMITIIGFVFVGIGVVGITMIAIQAYNLPKEGVETYVEGKFSRLNDEGIENTIRDWLDTPLYSIQRAEDVDDLTPELATQ